MDPDYGTIFCSASSPRFSSSQTTNTPQRDLIFVTDFSRAPGPGTPNAQPFGMQPQISFATFPHSHSDRSPRERFNHELTSDRHSVRLEVSIQADTRRLFHALTDPEYLEAWLSLPGHHPGCSMTAVRYDRDYLIDHFCNGRQSILISGRYVVLRRHHIVFSWRVDGEPTVPETSVEVRLRGDFERTTLILRHSGLASRRDSVWHRELWNTSISRLAGLYGATERLKFYA